MLPLKLLSVKPWKAAYKLRNWVKEVLQREVGVCDVDYRRLDVFWNFGYNYNENILIIKKKCFYDCRGLLSQLFIFCGQNINFFIKSRTDFQGRFYLL